jgi:SAM-dependent methyltransferase
VSRSRLEQHRRIWLRKPALRDVYRVWFDALLAGVPQGGRVLEVGAGPGFLGGYARDRSPGRRWIASDVLETPWNDLVADGQQLPFAGGMIDAVVGLDLVHHLARPKAFFVEVARVLRPGGRLIVVEPWVTAFSFPVYRWLHEEGCTPGLDPWRPFGELAEKKDAFQGDAAVVWRLLRRTSDRSWHELGFEPPGLTTLNGFAYLLSLGFQPGCLLPRRLAPLMISVDRWTAALSSVFAMRALVTWERRP